MLEQGQSYVVLGYGLTDRLDIHGYYSIHSEGFHTYYTGLFYQFLRSNKIDLATAAGMRPNIKNKKILRKTYKERLKELRNRYKSKKNNKKK